MGAVAGLAWDRLGRQARPQPAAERGAPHRLPVQHVVVGGPQRGRVPDGHLLLAVAQFGVVVLGPQALGAERAEQVHGEVVRQVEAGGGVAQAVIVGDQPVRPAGRVRLPAAEGELRLERGGDRIALGGRRGDGLLQVGARAPVPGFPRRQDLVGQHRARARGVRQRHERGRVGHDAHLADRAHAVHRLEVVQHGHGHHADRMPDPGHYAGRQHRRGRRLAPDDPAVVGIEEPDQRDVSLVRPCGDLGDGLFTGRRQQRRAVCVITHDTEVA